MAKIEREKGRTRKGLKDERLPLVKENFVILGVGLVTILLGYAAMLEGSVEGFLPIVAAPLLLVLGYCVILPLGILYRKEMFKRKESNDVQQGMTGKPTSASA